MLQTIHLEFEYQDKPLLKDINLHINPGELLHIRGINGAGKTTLLRLMAGLFNPNSGEILYQNTNIHEDLDSYQSNLCFIGHKPGIHPLLTVFENIYFDLQFDGKTQEIHSLAQCFQLEKTLDKPCHTLSAGQQRRVALIRLFMTKAKIWLLDEPLVALDDDSIAVLMKKIREHRDSGGMIILTSHQLLPEMVGDSREYWL